MTLEQPADVLVVGGGILGMATAWQLIRRRPHDRIVVVETGVRLGGHQTSHNSGVVHAGIYYPPGSAKAILCARGKDLLEEFCQERNIRLVRNGKVVVATTEDELDRLSDLYDRAVANKVPGLRRLNARELRDIEPGVSGLASIHSPSTGVVDFTHVLAALAEDLTAAGGEIHTCWPVSKLSTIGDRVEAVGPDGASMLARTAVVCAGLQADRLAGPVADGIRIIPFRGSWYEMRGQVAEDIRGSVYPVPDSRLPFLGVHVTRRVDGSVWAGPNAFLALSRTVYRRWAVQPRDAYAALAFGGLWRFAGRHVPAAWDELRHDLSGKSYARSLKRYLPCVTAEQLRRGPLGIRAQAMSPAGVLIDDFAIRRDRRILHVLNAPSPAATASLAIGAKLADDIDEIRGQLNCPGFGRGSVP